MPLNEYVRFTELNVMFYFSLALISPVLSPMLKGMGFSDIQLGLLFSVTPLVLIFSSAVLGRMADDLGKNTIIFSGIICEIFALLLYISGLGWGSVVAARVLDAVAAVTVGIALLAKIEDGLEDGLRGKYAGISLSVEYLGTIIAPVIGGVLADCFFIRAPFVTAIFLLAALLFFMPGKKLERRRPKREVFDWPGEMRRFLSNRKLRGMAILGVVMHATNPALTLFLPLLIIGEFDMGYTYVGYAFFALGAAHLLQFVFGKWADIKAYPVVLTGTLISGLFMAIVWKADTYLLILAILFLKGIGNAMWNISAWTLMSEVGVREKRSGEVIGTYISIAKIGAFLSFVASGFVVAAFGIPALFLLNGILILIGSAVAYPFLKD
ncbi:MAG: MFS transporter [Candidatus Aenigmatarchaeota archaeon]